MERHLTTTAIVLTTLLAVAGLAMVAPVATASDDTGDDLTMETTNESLANLQDDTCEGAPQMSQTSITSPEDRITSEQPGVVEANFRVDPSAPEDCDVVVDLEFSFAESGYQFGGGAEWDQSTTDLVATTFEGLNAGEIRDIRAELHTNGAQPGDEVTVIADYEIWYEGDRENSIQQSGIRHTIEVEEPNELDTDDDNSADDGTPISGNDNGELLSFVGENLEVIGLISALLIAVVGLVYREPIVQVIMGDR